MSCAYIQSFMHEADRKEILTFIEDMFKNGCYKAWKRKYVSPGKTEESTLKMYQPASVNLSTIISEYMDSVNPITLLTGNKTPFTTEETEKLNRFFKLNDWNNLYKTWMRNRKLYGDSYSSISLKDIEGIGQMPIIKTIPNKYVEIVESPTFNDYSLTLEDIDRELKMTTLNNVDYIVSFVKNYVTRIDDSTTSTQTIPKEIKFCFTKGRILTYHNSVLVENETIDYINTGLQSIVPIIHLQFEKEEDSNYSIIPSLDIIDDLIRLDRIETNIAETNHTSGSPTTYCIDGIFDEKSKFGAKAIAYVDTSPSAMRLGKQAKIEQLEITNGLNSLNTEKKQTTDSVYGKSNLISDTISETLAKSNSGKVVRFYDQDLMNEIKKGHEEISSKTTFIWEILFPNRKGEDIRLKVPNDIHGSTLYDKAAYINANIMTLREFKRDEGASEEEIEQFIQEVIEQTSIMSGTYAKIEEQKAQPAIEKTEQVSKDGEKVTVRDNNKDAPSKQIEGIDKRMQKA